MRVYRFAIANIAAAVLAEQLRAAGFNGTTTQSVGFGDWGTEPGNVVEIATAATALVFATVAYLLLVHGESCAYVTTDGASPRLLFSDGHAEPLS